VAPADKLVLAGAVIFFPRTPPVFGNRSSTLARIFAPSIRAVPQPQAA